MMIMMTRGGGNVGFSKDANDDDVDGDDDVDSDDDDDVYDDDDDVDIDD